MNFAWITHCIFRKKDAMDIHEKMLKEVAKEEQQRMKEIQKMEFQGETTVTMTNMNKLMNDE